MNRESLVYRMVSKTSLNGLEARYALDVMLEVITESIKAGERIEIRGFGVFTQKTNPSRKISLNCANKNPVLWSKKSISAKFKPAKELKAMVQDAPT